MAREIAEHHVGPAETDIESYAEPVPGLYVKEGGLSAASGFPGCAFVDQTFGHQLAHQDAYDAAGHSHVAGEVGPGDRLMFPYQVERDSAVDIPRSRPGGDMKIVRVDLAHLPLLRDDLFDVGPKYYKAGMMSISFYSE
jgi:hypothetical protein